MLNTHSLKFRLIGLGVLLVVIGVSLRLLVALPFAQEQLRVLVAAQQLSIASYVARDIDHCIETRRTLLGDLADTLPATLLQQPEPLAAWAKEQRHMARLVDKGLFVLAADGSLLAQSPLTTPAIADRAELSASDWFKAALRAGTPVLSKPQRERGSGQPILIIAAPLRDASNRVVAVLAGAMALNTPAFLERLQNTQLGISGSFLLIAPADQLIVGASDPALVLQSTSAAGISLLLERAAQGYHGSDITVDGAGVEQLSSIASVPSAGWFVIANTPTAEVFRPIVKMRGFIIKSTLAVLFGMIAILLLLLPRILRPLTDTARALREMADGHRELAPLSIRRPDEVGDLVLGFNYLATRLRAQETALKASEARLEFLAHHDALTGLCNRTLLEDRALQALARAQRHSSLVALLFCDLDGFKEINDQFGHEAGDAILRQVGARLLDGRRRTDTVARIGGDEFVVLLSDLTDARSAATRIAQQILATLGQSFTVEGKIFSLGASIGIALHDGTPTSISTLISQADTAMYQAKRAGKNGFRIFENTLELTPL